MTAPPGRARAGRARAGRAVDAARAPGDALHRLAALRGVACEFADAFGGHRRVSPDTLVAVLAALGEPLSSPADAAAALERHLVTEHGPAPVALAWDGRRPRRALDRLRRESGAVRGGLVLELEDGSDGSELLAGRSRGALPFGVHTARAGEHRMLVVSAPRKAPALAPTSWGLFAPAYALWDAGREEGALSLLGRLGRFAGGLGASYVATLPLLADYATADATDTLTSPYSPVSRMWWSEAYLDLAPFGVEAVRGRREGSIPPGHADLPAVATAVRNELGRLLARGHPALAGRRSDLDAFVRRRPDVIAYGAFRAAVEAAGPDRSRWPSSWAEGTIGIGRDVREEVVDLHVSAQWLLDEQMADLAASTAAAGCFLMLDLPIGCRPDGYDTWAFPSSFAGGLGAGAGTTVGAPPDAFFATGQNWGFRPLDPEGERRAGYPVVRACLSHLLRHAGALRIDHILGFQRLWWIPEGAEAHEGTYVDYPSEELAALACLEASRNGAALVGEDLGTVDPGVRRLMRRHAIAGMTVAVFDLDGAPGKPLRPPPGSCALVDTHDTATFAGWFDGTDLDQRLALGLLQPAEAEIAHRARARARAALVARLGCPADARSVHAALLVELGASDAGVVIATLEDFLGEHDPQNIPGTVAEHANFTRRLSEPLTSLLADDDLLAALQLLEAARDHARLATGSEHVAGRRRPPSGRGGA